MDRLTSEGTILSYRQPLAATIIFAAQEERDELSIPILHDAQHKKMAFLNWCAKSPRFDLMKDIIAGFTTTMQR